MYEVYTAVFELNLLYNTLSFFSSTQHEIFGDMKKLINKEFVQQAYLESVRLPNSDPPSYDFKWGARAHMETSKRNVLDFVCQVIHVERILVKIIFNPCTARTI